MNVNKKAVINMRIQKTAENLRKNNMRVFCVDAKDEVVPIVHDLLSEGDTVAAGGSLSLSETGVMELLRSGRYQFLDRSEKGLSDEEREIVIRKSFSADTYFCSSNAVIEDGTLYNVDGFSNRVAAICYGPKSVIMVVGYNKIVKDLKEAVRRVKSIAAPANCVRLDCDTYCKEKGECMSFLSDDSYVTAGCKSEERICCSYVVTAQQRIKDRITVILVAEELGF